MTRYLTDGVLCQQSPPSGGWFYLPEGSALPDWAIGLVGGHVLTEDDGSDHAPADDDGHQAGEVEHEGDEPDPAAADDREVVDVPPRSGPGSGRDHWADYADAVGIEVTAQMKRDDIIAALEAHGFIPEED